MTTWRATLAVNGHPIRQFNWDSASCAQLTTFTYRLESPLIRRGWNLIEIGVSQPGSIDVYELRLSAPMRKSAPPSPGKRAHSFCPLV